MKVAQTMLMELHICALIAAAIPAVAVVPDTGISHTFSRYEDAFAWEGSLNSPQAAAIDEANIASAFCPVMSSNTGMCEWCASVLHCFWVHMSIASILANNLCPSRVSKLCRI